MDSAIERIASNNISGAAEILRKAGDVFSQLRVRRPELARRSVSEARQAIIETAIALVRAQPNMSPLLMLASAAVSAAGTATNAADALKSAEDRALKFIEDTERAGRAAAVHASRLIRDGSAVLTHSRSSTVLAALISAKRATRDFSVVATESHPGLEGRTLAQTLARNGIRTSVIVDAAAPPTITRVDFVLVGADTITPDTLVNKIGTRIIALAARERGLPFYAVCDASKLVLVDYWSSPVSDASSANSPWQEELVGAPAGNSYFEPTPLAHVTGIITEDGILSSEEASRRARQASIDKSLSDAIEEVRKKIK